MRTYGVARLLKSHSPLPYYERALTSVREDPWVIAWKVGSDFLYRLATLMVLGFFVALFADHFARSMTRHGDLGAWAREVADLVLSKPFIAGSVGTLGVVLMLGMCLDAFIRGGIWGTLAQSTQQRPVIRWKTFFERGTSRFPAMIGFKLLSYLVWVFLLTLAAMLFVCVLTVTTTGAFADASPLTLGALWGMAGAIFFSITVLFRLTLAATCAPLFLEDRPLGEAIIVAASFVLEHTLQLYRLFLVMLGLTLIPLGLYWSVLMLQNLAIWFDTLVSAAATVRLVADFVLLASISAVSVFFYGALLAYYDGKEGEGPRAEVLPDNDETPCGAEPTDK